MINVCRPRILIGTLKLKDSSWPAFSTDIFSPRYLGDTWLPGSIYLDTWGILGYQVVYTQIPGGYLATRQYTPGYLEVLGYQVAHTKIPGVRGNQVVYTQIPGGYLVTRQYRHRYLLGYLAIRQYIPGNLGVLATRQYISRYMRGTWLPGSMYTQIPGRYLAARFMASTWLPGSIYLDTWGVLGYRVVYIQIPGGYQATRQYIPRYLGVLGYQLVYIQIPGGYLATRQYIPRYLGVRGNQVVYTQIPEGVLCYTWEVSGCQIHGQYLATRLYIPMLPGSIYTQMPGGYFATRKYIPTFLGGCLPRSIYLYTLRYLFSQFLSLREDFSFPPVLIVLAHVRYLI